MSNFHAYSPDESSSHTDSKSPTTPRTEPYTIESSHMKKLPFTMKPLESTTLPFVVKLNETAEIFDMVSLPMNIYLVCYMCRILLLQGINF